MKLGGTVAQTNLPVNCIDCPHHKVIADPDPEDWFNDDDVAVECQKSPNTEIGKFPKSVAYKQKLRVVTSMCRPYNTRNESETPTWCPLKEVAQPTVA